MREYQHIDLFVKNYQITMTFTMEGAIVKLDRERERNKNQFSDDDTSEWMWKHKYWTATFVRRATFNQLSNQKIILTYL